MILVISTICKRAIRKLCAKGRISEIGTCYICRIWRGVCILLSLWFACCAAVANGLHVNVRSIDDLQNICWWGSWGHVNSSDLIHLHQSHGLEFVDQQCCLVGNLQNCLFCAHCVNLDSASFCEVWCAGKIWRGLQSELFLLCGRIHLVGTCTQWALEQKQALEDAFEGKGSCYRPKKSLLEDAMQLAGMQGAQGQSCKSFSSCDCFFFMLVWWSCCGLQMCWVFIVGALTFIAEKFIGCRTAALHPNRFCKIPQSWSEQVTGRPKEGRQAKHTWWRLNMTIWN